MIVSDEEEGLRFRWAWRARVGLMLRRFFAGEGGGIDTQEEEEWCVGGAQMHRCVILFRPMMEGSFVGQLCVVAWPELQVCQ